jgi:hypothetical protein
MELRLQPLLACERLLGGMAVVTTKSLISYSTNESPALKGPLMVIMTSTLNLHPVSARIADTIADNGSRHRLSLRSCLPADASVARLLAAVVAALLAQPLYIGQTLPGLVPHAYNLFTPWRGRREEVVSATALFLGLPHVSLLPLDVSFPS